jgi:hypothetical protein
LLSTVEKRVENKALRGIKLDATTRGILTCCLCFHQLQEIEPPRSDTVDDTQPPPPPPTLERMSDETVEEKESEACSIEGEPCTAIGPLDLDLDNCTVHIKKEAPSCSPTERSKKGKKGKKNKGAMNGEVVQALFFEDPRRSLSEDGELAIEPLTSEAHASPSRRTTPAGADLSPVVSTELHSPVTTTKGLATPSTAVQWPAVAKTASKAVAKSTSASSTLKTQSSALRALPGNQVTDLASTTEPPTLPAGWKAALDPASKNFYYYHVKTRNVTWEIPTDESARSSETAVEALEKKSKDAVMDASACSLSSASTAASTSSASSQNRNSSSLTAADRRAHSPTLSQAQSVPSSVQYLVTHTWTPRQEDRDCIRLIHGERVILEAETKEGWGIGTVVPEAGETARSGHFPRWALSDIPAPDPKPFVPGARAMVMEKFVSPANGYLTIAVGEIVTVKYQVDPLIWVYVEATSDSSRRGWVPEVALVLK